MGAIEATLCIQTPSRLCVAVWLSLESAGSNDDDEELKATTTNSEEARGSFFLSAFANSYLQNRQRVRSDAAFFTDEKALSLY